MIVFDFCQFWSFNWHINNKKLKIEQILTFYSKIGQNRTSIKFKDQSDFKFVVRFWIGLISSVFGIRIELLTIKFGHPNSLSLVFSREVFFGQGKLDRYENYSQVIVTVYGVKRVDRNQAMQALTEWLNISSQNARKWEQRNAMLPNRL